MSNKRNPSWTKDEVILALDLYFKVNPLRVNETTIEIVELSQLLNELPFHAEQDRDSNFRNPAGVHMILCNFLRFDSRYETKGLERGSQLQKEVWDEFAGRIGLLRKAANQIRERTMKT